MAGQTDLDMQPPVLFCSRIVLQQNMHESEQPVGMASRLHALAHTHLRIIPDRHKKDEAQQNQYDIQQNQQYLSDYTEYG